MIFEETPLAGVVVLKPERFEDERGFFARTYCRQEFEEHGLDPAVEQCNVSYNHRRGTLRGLHFQAPPHEEDKLVRVTRGAIYDVAVDLRPSSSTFKEVFGVELTAENGWALYVPKGCGHGFQVLEDETEVFYQMSRRYAPGAGRGYRWDDPAFAVPWPLEPTVMSEKDQELPYFREEGSS